MKSIAGLGSLVVLVLTACGSVVPLASASPSFSPGQSTLPTARAGAGLAYDPGSQQLLLIGGMADPLHPPQSDAPPGRDFWAWRAAGGWQQIQAEIVPPAGYMSSLVWDPAANRMVLVGLTVSSVWTWDGAAWSAGGAGPRLSTFSGAAYDIKGRTVRVLGRPADLGDPGGSVVVPAGGDWSAYRGEAMWSWNGSAWGFDPTPMSGRDQAAVAYDAARGNLVVYGGFGDGDTGTWIFDGATWTGVAAASVPTAAQSSAAYDPIHHQVVLHTALGETWTWDGRSWSIRSTSGPAVRRDESMAYDSEIGRVVLFGGKVPQGSEEVYMNDLWAWDGSHWARLA